MLQFVLSTPSKITLRRNGLSTTLLSTVAYSFTNLNPRDFLLWRHLKHLASHENAIIQEFIKIITGLKPKKLEC